MMHRGRRYAVYGLGLICLMTALAGAALVMLGPFDLAPAAARRATRSLGRPVAIAVLQVRVGATVTVELHDLTIDNLPAGSPGPFLRIGRLDAETTPWSLLGWALLGRPPIVRHLSVTGVRLLMEHAADGRPNWRFGDPKPAADGNPRTRFPTLLDARLGDGALEFHTSSGQVIQVRLDQAAIAAAAPDQPATLGAGGAYEDAPVQLTGALQSFDRLHDEAAPFGAKVHLASDDTVLDFDGSLTRPINADGVSGKLSLQAPSLDRLLAIGGVGGRFAAPIALAGGFDRAGDVWRLTEGKGTLGAHPLTLAVRLQEGVRHAPDDITLDAGFAVLDLTAFAGGHKLGETALRIDADPGTRLEAHVAAKEFVYGDLKAEDLDLAARLAPGALTIEKLGGRYAGGTLAIGGTVTNADKGAAVRIDGALDAADAGQLTGLLALGTVPLTGSVDVRLGIDAAGNSVAEAMRSVRGGLALSMLKGSIARDIVEKASTDVRLAFRTSDAVDPVSCLFGLVALRDGVGPIGPLRLRTPDGTIVGAGTIDLRRDAIDLTFATESATTSVFALDVPVRFAGAIEAPHLLPALGGPKPGNPDLAALPPAVQDLARRNPCLTAAR